MTTRVYTFIQRALCAIFGLRVPVGFSFGSSWLFIVIGRKAKLAWVMAEDTSEFEFVEDEGFVRFNLRRPVNFYLPSKFEESYDIKEKTNRPKEYLELEWVYGYRGRDCRSNLFPLASGEVIYFAAAVAVIYNPESKTQRHFTGHTDDIRCLAVHPDGRTVATGQTKGRENILPHVCIWDSDNFEILHVIGSGNFSRSVSCIAFSKDGGILAAVDEAQEPRLSIWQWGDEKCIAQARASSGSVLGVAFTYETPFRIITTGKSHIGFWWIGEDNGELKKKSGVYGDDWEKPKYISSVITLENGEVITGDSNGNILVWEEGGNTIKRGVKSEHPGSIFYLTVTEFGNFLSAGKGRKIIEYNSELEPTGEVIELPEEYGTPRIAFQKGSDVYIGTMKNAIIKTTFEYDPTVITQGHLEEVWALAVHHTDPFFLTAGQDNKVYYRDAKTHDVVWSKDIGFPCQSADMSLGNQVTVITSTTGKWIALDNETQENIHEEEDGEEPIQVTRFSPDGTKLALGSRDNKIYIYNFDEEGKSFSKRGECEGHSSFITHLDWSMDGEMLRTNSGDYEVLYWKVEDCLLVSEADDYKDVEWATNNCILSFNAIGIWPPGTDGTHINSCNKGNEKSLMATGDDFGMMKLFTYPSCYPNAKFRDYHAHSSHITSLQFVPGDSNIISTGGRDTTAMQWKVIEPDEDEEEEEGEDED